MRSANPQLSSSGKDMLADYRQVLWEHKDLTGASRHNYLSDFCHVVAWYEFSEMNKINNSVLPQVRFDHPQVITTQALVCYRMMLVAEMVGHKYLETTRRYSLPSLHDRKDAMEALYIEY